MRIPTLNCSSSRRDISSSLGGDSCISSESTGNCMCASHLRSGKLRARRACLHSPVLASMRYIGSKRQPCAATARTAANVYSISASDAKYGKLTRAKPGRNTSALSSKCASIAAASAGDIPRRRCAYGPAHAHPPRACTPKTSFNTAHVNE